MSISQSHSNENGFATFDHIVPRSKGGPNALTNLKLAHKRCNGKRGNAPLLTQATSEVRQEPK